MGCEKGETKEREECEGFLSALTSRIDVMSTAQLQSLLSSPPPSIARQEAQSYLSTSLGSLSTSTNPSLLAPLLSQLLEQQQSHSQELEHKLKASEERKGELLNQAKETTSSIRKRTNQLRSDNERIKEQSKQVRDQLVGKLDKRIVEGDESITLRDQLIRLSTRRKELQGAKKWFAIIVKAEELGYVSLLSLSPEEHGRVD